MKIILFFLIISNSFASDILDKVSNYSFLDDYVKGDSSDKKVRFQIVPSFQSNRHTDVIHEKAKKSVHTAFAKTFASTPMEGDFKSIFLKSMRKNLISSFIDNYVKKLTFYKIFNGAYQMDLNITPFNDTPKSLDYELSTNQMINFGAKSKLLSYLVKEDKTLKDQILEVDYPKSDDRFQFLGGNVSLWLKLLDMNWKLLKIPSPKKNALKGAVVYRKHFNFNGQKLTKIEDIDDLTNLVLVVEEVGNKAVLTIDRIETLNLKSIVPSLKVVRYFFGSFVTDKKNINTSPTKRAVFPSSFNNGKFTVRGVYKKKYPFEAQLQYISYDFENKKIDMKNSKIIMKMDTLLNAFGLSDRIKESIFNNKDFLENVLETKRFLK